MCLYTERCTPFITLTYFIGETGNRNVVRPEGNTRIGKIGWKPSGENWPHEHPFSLDITDRATHTLLG